MPWSRFCPLEQILPENEKLLNSRFLFFIKYCYKKHCNLNCQIIYRLILFGLTHEMLVLFFPHNDFSLLHYLLHLFTFQTPVKTRFQGYIIGNLSVAKV